MTDMVEKVGLAAMLAAHKQEPLVGPYVLPEERWASDGAFRAYWCAVARAAIAAMREPTEEMRVAALNGGLPGPGDPPLYEMVWRTMIDAALTERPSSAR